MDDREKVLAYEMHIEDMLNTLNERYAEFDNKNTLSEFEEGRKLAYYEIRDIIKTRHEMILELLDSE